MLRTRQDLSIRELHDNDLRSIQGGTSAMIYAVAEAAYKVMAANDDSRLKQGVITPAGTGNGGDDDFGQRYRS